MKTIHDAVKKPTNWEKEPTAYLGTDGDSSYWALGNDAYKVSADGSSTRWLCTLAAWPVYVRIYAITEA